MKIEQNYKRDMNRWEYEQKRDEKDSKHVDFIQDRFKKRNSNSIGKAYNLITLDYQNNESGQLK